MYYIWGPRRLTPREERNLKLDRRLESEQNYDSLGGDGEWGPKGPSGNNPEVKKEKRILQ